MKVADLLRSVDRELRRDAELILSHLLKAKPSQIPLRLRDRVSEGVVSQLHDLIDKRLGGIPTAYLTGEWEFMGHTFFVEEGVLVPRPETELLVEKVLGEIPEDRAFRGFEVGVGTGCISISILLNRRLVRMEGSDVNPSAVRLTLRNGKLHGVLDRLSVYHGSFMEPASGLYDFILSNPPYIPSGEWESLPPEVRREGRASLIAGETGLEVIRGIVDHSRLFLREGGFIALEIGHDQGEEVKRVLRSAGFRPEVFKDLSGQDRIAIGWS